MSGVIGNITTQFLNNPGRNNSSYPQKLKAFINYVFLDEQFKYVDGGFSAVNNTPGLKDHYSELQNKVALKNGYVYISVSNESPVTVFFDNLQVVHTRGAILEETHYYPFGLIQSGISSKVLAFGNSENKRKFIEKELQNMEFSDGSGLDWYDLTFRTLDNQIGRFLQIDPLSDNYKSNTTYAYSENRPINGIDLEGLEFYYTADGRLLGHRATDANGNTLSENVSNSVKLATSVEHIDNQEWKGDIYHGVQDLNISHDEFLKASSIIRQELGDVSSLDEAKGIAHTFFNAANKDVNKLLRTLNIESSVGNGGSGSRETVFGDENSSIRVVNSRAGLLHALSGSPDITNGATQFDGSDFLAWGTTKGPWHGGMHAKFTEYNQITIGADIYNTHYNNLLKLNPSGLVSWRKYNVIKVPIAAEVFLDKKNWSTVAFQYNTGRNVAKSLTATAAFGGTIFWRTE